ncbi:MAG: TonB-dependent receptor [Bacteroidetes bacterium]|nr:TonB-dependent receptor [Fibrella sp.]
MLLILAGSSTTLAQGVTTSSITGAVTDDKNEGLPGATVVAVHTPSGTRYGTVTNTQGRYTFPAVRIGGPYAITVSFVGYQTQDRTLQSADLGVPVEANFKVVEEGRQLSEVIIRDQRGSIIDGERTGASTNFKQQSFERLPSLQRSFSDFTNLTPQASGNFSFGGRSNLYNNFSIDGATSNNVFGLSATPGGQSNAQPISIDAIQEVSVQLAPYDVTQGSFTGAGVNAVTRSGTNEFQGSIYGFSKNQNLANKNVEGVSSPLTSPFEYVNAGFRVGGPIIKNKLFFFVNGEYEKSTAPGVPVAAGSPGSNVFADSLRQLQQFLLTPGTGNKTWSFDPGQYLSYDVPIQNTKFLVKIDWSINDQHKLTVRYNQLNAYRDQTISGSGGFTTAPNGGRSNTINTLPFSNSFYRIKNDLYSIFGELNSTFGKGKYANNLQLGYSALRDIRQSGGGGEVPSFPTVDILNPATGIVQTSFGPDPFTPNNRLDQDIIQVNDRFDLFLGNHTVSLGTANEFYQFYNVFTQVINGVYEYNSFGDFFGNATTPTAANSPRRYYQQYSAIAGQPAPAADFSATQLGFYAQDSYAGIKNLRLTVGARVDIPIYGNANFLKNANIDSVSRGLYPNGNAVPGFANQEQIDVSKLPNTTPLFSPRIGFNWDVLGDKSVQVRGGTGIFTGRVPFVWISNQLSNNGVFFGQTQSQTKGVNGGTTTQYPFSPNINEYVPGRLQEVTPERLSISPSTASYAINSTVSNFKFPQVFRSNVAVDKTLGGGFVGTLEAIYTKDVNAIYIRDANLANPVGTLAGDGRPLYGAVAGSILLTPPTVVNAPNDRRLNDRITQALIIDNINKGYALSLTAQIQKTSGRLNGSLAYTFTDSKDINAQSASTAGSLYTGNQYVTNLNSPNLSYANNWTPHRVVGYASYRLDYLNTLATTLSLTYEGRNGGNFSYVYGGDPNSDGVGNADLIYVPRNQSEILLTTTNATDPRTTQQIWEQLNNYIEQDPYLKTRRGQYAERNGALLPWVNFLNFRLLQDVYVKVGGKRNTLQFSWEVNNVLNFLDSDWGILKQPARSSLLNFVGYETPNTAATPTTGRPIFTFATNTIPATGTTPARQEPLANSYTNNLNINGPVVNSRWQMQFGLRYIFN